MSEEEEEEEDRERESEGEEEEEDFGDEPTSPIITRMTLSMKQSSRAEEKTVRKKMC